MSDIKIKSCVSISIGASMTLLYAPTWHKNTESFTPLTMTPELLEKYYVIYKGHIPLYIT
jgi:hypothetical protein